MKAMLNLIYFDQLTEVSTSARKKKKKKPCTSRVSMQEKVLHKHIAKLKSLPAG